MYRMLMVDDEPIIVNGLNEYFMKKGLHDVEVVLAYSAVEAISRLDDLKIDVVLSDICMPEMDGMELLGHIETRWPRCKVILLTGHDEFDYAQQALRSSCIVDYILKTEGMDKIGEAVDRALAMAREELSVYHQKEWLQTELPKVMSQLQRQLLLDVLRRTDMERFRGLQSEFDALKLPFKADKPVMLILLGVEDWGKYETVHERNLMLFAIGNAAEELLGAKTKVKFAAYDHSSLIGFVQSRDPLFENAQTLAEKTAKFTHGTLESVQQVCRDLLGTPLSAAATMLMHPFEEASREVHGLRLAILNGQAKGVERLSIVGSPQHKPEESPDRYSRPTAQYALGQIKQSMLDGNGHEWSRYYAKFMALFPPDGPSDPFDRMMILHHLAETCVICLEELGLKDRAVSQTDLPRILQLNHTVPWEQTLAFYQAIFEWMQRTRSEYLSREESHLIGRIAYFVQNHLDSDLSLSRIAREVSLNPSYLSRWYKQTTGKGLSDYIQEAKIEKSKELLQTTSYKVHEISEKLGFTDPHYFFRFFKKAMGCTPQEYRNGIGPAKNE
ncbi:response regulator [Paenibacillus arenilitoris]|uniref:Response regulator n=1 Tax=Paenibacillus arenilitoris TaxID=2772299 RepID=A0A927CG97_9BACL|nr:response regulator [Paenibacillus arenilitoris]MBD2867000.1 response regulator [Paenibacillus arenilitoris]